MAAKTKSPKEMPGNLAFDRRIEVSDALMFSGKWKDIQELGANPAKIHEIINGTSTWEKIPIVPKELLGVKSHRMTDINQIEKETKDPNPQAVDDAALPAGADTLKVHFTFRVLGELATRFVCTDPEIKDKISEIISDYTCSEEDGKGFKELSKRYAWNIANGRFLWRNRVCAEEIKVCVSHNEQSWVFNSSDYELNTFPVNHTELNALAETIQKGLMGDSKTHVFIEVTAFVRLGKLQHVWPSQEMVTDNSNSKGFKKGKFLYALDGTAAIHSQKIGNAIRTIDTWYDEEVAFPIAAEVYGSVTSQGRAYRSAKNTDFYTLLDNWVLNDTKPSIEQQHYIMAVLVRGGVFGKSQKDKNEE